MRLLRRRCACGCGEITNYGKRCVHGHNKPWKGKTFSKEHKENMSLSRIGNTFKKGTVLSKKQKLTISLSCLKSHPNDEYCEAWRDKEFKDDLRKDYCENVDCKESCKSLLNHHINLNKKDCRPSNVMTLCRSCHAPLHHQLGRKINYKDFITIIRKDRITYVHKETRKKVTIKRI